MSGKSNLAFAWRTLKVTNSSKFQLEKTKSGQEKKKDLQGKMFTLFVLKKQQTKTQKNTHITSSAPDHPSTTPQHGAAFLPSARRGPSLSSCLLSTPGSEIGSSCGSFNLRAEIILILLPLFFFFLLAVLQFHHSHDELLPVCVCS